jgi:hypothetical protein
MCTDPQKLTRHEMLENYIHQLPSSHMERIFMHFVLNFTEEGDDNDVCVFLIKIPI